MSSQPLGTHIMPTHLNLPDQVLSIGTFTLTARQFLLLLVGSSVGYALWQDCAVLGRFALPGLGLRGGIALFPVAMALLFAVAQIAGRPLEIWLVVLLRYWWQPKRFVWRSVRVDEAWLFHGSVSGETEEEEVGRFFWKQSQKNWLRWRREQHNQHRGEADATKTPHASQRAAEFSPGARHLGEHAMPVLADCFRRT